MLYDNLEEWFIFHPENVGTVEESSNEKVVIQFLGFELILNPDGTYILSDTTG